MSERKGVEYIHEGCYVAEVDVTLIETDSEWAPYFSVEDANKLDRVRDALRHGDLKSAAKESRVFQMTPVAAE